MTKPLVSVVMPVKECNPTFLERSIESILQQTLPNLELLLIFDDTDSVNRPLITKFEKDERLRIILNKGHGFVEALNTGLLMSRGKYIARMDADDISSTNRLQLQIDAIEKNNFDFVGGWAYVIDENGLNLGKLRPPTNAQKIKKIIMFHNPFLHSTVTFKKSVLKRSGVYNLALFGAEDYELWLRIVALGYKCANLPHFVLYLREVQDSIVRGKNWKKTRVNYSKAKVLGLTKWGYHDPLSVTSCFASPFSSLMTPKIAFYLKSFLRWFEKTDV